MSINGDEEDEYRAYDWKVSYTTPAGTAHLGPLGRVDESARAHRHVVEALDGLPDHVVDARGEVVCTTVFGECPRVISTAFRTGVGVAWACPS